MTPEDKMAALFRADTPPARDFAFEAGVAQRLARRRMWATIAAMVPLAIAAAAGLWGLQPVAAALTETVPLGAGDPLALTLSAVAMAGVGAFVAIWGAGRFGRV